jgi:4-carboxymuconolactone decarboxylase
MQKHGEEYERGLAILEELHGGQAGEAMVREMADVCPDFCTMTIEWALGCIMARPGLDLATRELLLVASCATLGNAEPQLRAHMESARKLGISREQMVEALLTLLFYAGGPAVRNALLIVREVYALPHSTDPSAGSHESHGFLSG